jgi:hypothetical protein
MTIMPLNCINDRFSRCGWINYKDEWQGTLELVQPTRLGSKSSRITSTIVIGLEDSDSSNCFDSIVVALYYKFAVRSMHIVGFRLGTIAELPPVIEVIHYYLVL